jgi:protein-disulfide isomerase
MRIAGGLAAALALFVFPTVTAAAVKAPVKRTARADWTHTFAVSPQGGFRIGNPKAKFAIIEYGSLTCPHCRHFAETGMKPLIDQYVRSGKASYEFRSFVLNGIDLAATLVARCDGPARFFPMAEELYSTQPDWIGKIQNLPKDQQDKLNALDNGALMLAIAKAGGLLPVASAHGIPATKVEACLKNESAAMNLMKVRQSANRLGVEGTPTFFINSKKVSAYDWPTLEPFLKGAGG